MALDIDGREESSGYLIDEADNPEKGADCIIALVHTTRKLMVAVRKLPIFMQITVQDRTKTILSSSTLLRDLESLLVIMT